MITIRNVNKSYQGQPILQHVNLTIEKGDFVFLRGASGSGKTTLLKMLYREIDHYDGEITFEGVSIQTIPKHRLRQKAATIFQSYELLEKKTVLENVMLAGEVMGKPRIPLQKDALELLQKVGLEGKEHRFPTALSGGEQQRVAIARALLNSPTCLFADEPTGNLDSENAHAIMSLLRDINQRLGITMVIVTHSDDLVQAFPHRLITIEKGVVKG